MATFSTKQYFKKITAHPLLTELYKRSDIQAFFEIGEQTPKKNVASILYDFFNTLEIEKKITIEEELTATNNLATPHGEYLFSLLLKERGLSTITTIECKSLQDLSLYYYLFHKDIFDEVEFFHSFFVKPSYLIYEAKKVDLSAALLATSSLTKEYERILEKEGNPKEYENNAKTLGGILYYKMKIREVSANRKENEIRVAYLPETKEVLLSYTSSKYDKLVLLDTFLRVVCQDGYLEKVEKNDFSLFKNESFEFSQSAKGTPFLSWKVKAISLSLGEEESRKKIRLSLPSKQEAKGLSPLFNFYEDLGIKERLVNSTIDSITLSFYFIDQKKKDKTIHVPVTLSTSRVTLCPLFYYHAFTRTILRNASIYQGFVEQEKKKKEDVTKKWEV